MSLIDNDFNELIDRIKVGREFHHASFEPIFYLIFPPKDIINVKRKMPAWKSRLTNDGWSVNVLSISETIHNLIDKAPLKTLWTKADKKLSYPWVKTNEALSNYLVNGKFQESLEDEIKKIKEQNKPILIMTDLEGLHPYLRIGSFETQLRDSLEFPIIILYPGERTGKTRLKFLGFYPEDGNYRSVHVGG
jgi:hypothetical protein